MYSFDSCTHINNEICPFYLPVRHLFLSPPAEAPLFPVTSPPPSHVCFAGVHPPTEVT